MNNTLYTYLVALLPVAGGVAMAIVIRFAFSRIALHELKVAQDQALEAHRVIAAGSGRPGGSPIAGSQEASLARIAGALEQLVAVQRRSSWEWIANFLGQAALVVGAVVSIANLVKR